MMKRNSSIHSLLNAKLMFLCFLQLFQRNEAFSSTSTRTSTGTQERLVLRRSFATTSQHSTRTRTRTRTRTTHNKINTSRYVRGRSKEEESPHVHVAGEYSQLECGRRRQEGQEQELEEQVEVEVSMDLDVILKKARKRKMVLLPYRIQAIANKPVLNLFNFTSLTIGECALILVAIKLNSYGFCVGYVIGKGTSPFVRNSNMPIALVELWTVLLAVGFDVIWNNLD